MQDAGGEPAEPGTPELDDHDDRAGGAGALPGGPPGPQSSWVGCPRFTDPDWLPASAWQDPAFRPFVPHSYQVCLVADEFRLSPAEVLPAEAVDLLLGPESPLADRPPARGVLCRGVANPVARELANVMDHAGPGYVRHEDDLALGYVLPIEGGLMFLPVLPHGGTYAPGG